MKNTTIARKTFCSPGPASSAFSTRSTAGAPLSPGWPGWTEGSRADPVCCAVTRAGAVPRAASTWPAKNKNTDPFKGPIAVACMHFAEPLPTLLPFLKPQLPWTKIIYDCVAKGAYLFVKCLRRFAFLSSWNQCNSETNKIWPNDFSSAEWTPFDDHPGNATVPLSRLPLRGRNNFLC